MEAVPRLPMLSFETKHSTEAVSFSQPIKTYIAHFYGEDPESYNPEIQQLENLRGAAVRPTIDVAGVQLLKRYFCQLHFLKSRFPMEASQSAAINFGWKDPYSGLRCNVADIRFEIMCILYNIGAIHTQLGANDSRTSPEGMKMACTHFQCAAWAFQTLKESYYQMVSYISPIEVVNFMQQVCLAQAQECILEKSMMDNRKATIIAKVAVQVVDFYKKALVIIKAGEESSLIEFVERKAFKEWTKYLSFKVAYHKCIALLFQGQQAEEQQKMGERVAFYQAASEQLEEARKLASGLKQQKEVSESLAFTLDVVEGKKKAAKNENEFIYHEEVPEKDALQEVKGASLVKGIPFSVNDIEVSGPDIFAKLVPMEAHEAASLYSEKKAQLLRKIGELIESKDQALAEFMSSMQLDVITQMRSATGLPQELVDRAAALSAKPTACQDLIGAMNKLSNSYQDVEAMLKEINELLKEEEQSEKEYQELMGKRPPSIIATDLSREAAKYKEAHTKANDSNQNLHKAMTTHVANLKILAQPLMQLQQQIPVVELPNPNVDDQVIQEVESLISKVEEMRNQRAMLWAQLREAVHQDDITNVLVTKPEDMALEQLFQQQLDKHKQIVNYIEQNALAQENILKVFVDVYARSANSRKYLQDVINKRNSTVTALITSFDSYEDLLATANKGIEFYNKLETNVAKLLQRIKSACKVQQEEREQILAKNLPPKEETVLPVAASATPKLKDYLDSRNKVQVNPTTYVPDPKWPSGIRPTPVGSEENDKIDDLTDKMASLRASQYYQYYQNKASTNTTNSYQTISSVPAMQMTGEISNPATSTYSDSNLSNYMYTNSAGYGTVQNPTYPTPTPPATYLPAGTDASYQQNYQYPMGQTYSGYMSASSTYPMAQNYSGLQSYPIGQGTLTSQSYPSAQSYGTTQQPYPTYSTTQPTSDTVSTVTTPTVPVSVTTAASVLPTAQGYQQTTTMPQSYQQVYPTDPSQLYLYSQQGGNEVYPGGSTLPNTVQSSTVPSSYYSMSTNAVTTTTTSYPYGAEAASQVYPSSVTPQPANQFYQVYPPNSTATIQYPTSSTPQVTYPQSYTPNQNYTSTDTQSSLYQYPSTGMYYQDPNYNYYYYSQQPYQSQQQPQQQSTTTESYSNVAPPPTTTIAPTTAPSVSTKESNVDLLSGLDFTINQAPLIPQQKPEQQQQQQKTETPTATIKTPPKVSTPPPPSQPTILTPIINKKPLNNSEVKKIFQQELERYEKFVETLCNKTLSGPTNLDLKWKEIIDKQDSENSKKVISVARCYPMKNRYSDILPYDNTRVELKGTKDDYINASWIKNISIHSPIFIVTQTPLQTTIIDFWTMCWEQNIEMIVFVEKNNNTNELNKEIYWPQIKGKDLIFSTMVISLMSENIKTYWIERLISITVPEKRESRVIIQLQFIAWPGSLFPNSPDYFINFIKELITFYYQQRNPSHPIVVHCNSGIGKSGLICLLMIALLEITNNTKCMPDLVALTTKLTSCRKNILRDREHLKFAFEAFLCYMKQILQVSGHSRKSSDVSLIKKEEKSNVKEEPSDPLSSLDPFWASKKSN